MHRSRRAVRLAGSRAVASAANLASRRGPAEAAETRPNRPCIAMIRERAPATRTRPLVPGLGWKPVLFGRFHRQHVAARRRDRVEGAARPAIRRACSRMCPAWLSTRTAARPVCPPSMASRRPSAHHGRWHGDHRLVSQSYESGCCPISTRPRSASAKVWAGDLARSALAAIRIGGAIVVKSREPLFAAPGQDVVTHGSIGSFYARAMATAWAETSRRPPRRSTSSCLTRAPTPNPQRQFCGRPRLQEI